MRLYYWKINVGHTVEKANENTLKVATLQRANGYCADWARAEHTLAACTCFLLHAGHLATCLSFFLHPSHLHQLYQKGSKLENPHPYGLSEGGTFFAQSLHACLLPGVGQP